VQSSLPKSNLVMDFLGKLHERAIMCWTLHPAWLVSDVSQQVAIRGVVPIFHSTWHKEAVDHVNHRLNREVHPS